MLQPATLGLCISLLADLFPVGPGSRVDLATGARAELNVGRIPVNAGSPSESGTEETIVLRSGVRLMSPTSTFSLSYTPQYYLRLPDALGVGRPLLLHDGGLLWLARLSPRVSMNFGLRSSAGELSNSGFQLFFEPGTGRLEASIVPIFRLSSNLGMSALTGKRQTTTVALSGSHNDSLGDSTALTTSDNLALSLSHSIGLSPRTSAGISAQGGYVGRDESDSATVGGQLFLSQQLTPSGVLRVGVGANQGWALGGSVSWPLPTVDVGYRTRFTGAGQSWNLDVSSGTRAFFDVTSAIYRPQVFLSAGVTGTILQTWTVGSTLTFSADISGSNLTAGGQPTQFRFNVPIGYRISETVRLAFGLRLALSAPPISMWDTSDGTIQDQVSVFVSLDWSAGTDRNRGGWL
jgi:hypothetical protein